MNGRQMAEEIGKIDDQLVQQAGKLPDYKRKNRIKVLMRAAACAAAMVLMAGSFAAGAVVFAKETIVEVPVEQESVLLEEIGLTLILPSEWKGQYGIKVGGMEGGYLYTFYDKTIYEQEGEWAECGILFYIGAYGDRPMTQEELEAENVLDGAIPYEYLCSTKRTNYIRVDVTDVQYDMNDPETARHYEKLIAGIPEIRFVLEDML
ncbi:MAG: hypothetical protein K2O06_10425 [Acetatifactor sp.]|nr:hypothetical protein [Acetatifactor sp.]